MSTPGQQEVVTRAVLEKAPVAPPPPGSPQEQAIKIREELATKQPRTVTESLKGGEKIQGRKIDELIEKNSGTERAADGSKTRTPGAETDRYDQMKKWSRISKEFFEKGYEHLTNDDKLDVNTEVALAIKSWPEGEILLNALSPAEELAVIEDIVKNPKYKDLVRKAFDGATDSGKTLVDSVSGIKDIFEQAKKKEEDKGKELFDNQRETAYVATQLNEFKLGARKDNELSMSIRDLPANQAKLQSIKDGIADKGPVISFLQAQLSRAGKKENDALAEINDKIIAEKQEIRKMEREASEVQEKINRKAELENEKLNLESKKRSLEEAKTKLEQDHLNLQKDKLTKQADLATAKLSRGSEEQDFADSLKNVFMEATMDYLEEKVRLAEEIQNRLIDEEKAKTVDPTEQKMWDGIKNRWDKFESKGGRYSSKIKKDQTKKDYGDLLAYGPKYVMKEMLMENCGLTPKSPERRAYEAEVDAKLANNEFIDKFQHKVVERLVSRQIQSGKITEDDVRLIRESDWGEDVLQKAIANKAGLREEIEALYKENVLDKGFWDAVKKKSNGNFLMMLLLIVGSGIKKIQ